MVWTSWSGSRITTDRSARWCSLAALHRIRLGRRSAKAAAPVSLLSNTACLPPHAAGTTTHSALPCMKPQHVRKFHYRPKVGGQSAFIAWACQRRADEMEGPGCPRPSRCIGTGGRSGRTPALPYPPIRQAHSTSSCHAGKASQRCAPRWKAQSVKRLLRPRGTLAGTEVPTNFGTLMKFRTWFV